MKLRKCLGATITATSILFIMFTSGYADVNTSPAELHRFHLSWLAASAFIVLGLTLYNWTSIKRHICASFVFIKMKYSKDRYCRKVVRRCKTSKNLYRFILNSYETV